MYRARQPEPRLQPHTAKAPRGPRGRAWQKQKKTALTWNKFRATPWKEFGPLHADPPIDLQRAPDRVDTELCPNKHGPKVSLADGGTNMKHFALNMQTYSEIDQHRAYTILFLFTSCRNWTGGNGQGCVDTWSPRNRRQRRQRAQGMWRCMLSTAKEGGTRTYFLKEQGSC